MNLAIDRVCSYRLPLDMNPGRKFTSMEVKFRGFEELAGMKWVQKIGN